MESLWTVAEIFSPHNVLIQLSGHTDLFESACPVCTWSLNQFKHPSFNFIVLCMVYPSSSTLIDHNCTVHSLVYFSVITCICYSGSACTCTWYKFQKGFWLCRNSILLARKEFPVSSQIVHIIICILYICCWNKL